MSSEGLYEDPVHIWRLTKEEYQDYEDPKTNVLGFTHAPKPEERTKPNMIHLTPRFRDNMVGRSASNKLVDISDDSRAKLESFLNRWTVKFKSNIPLVRHAMEPIGNLLDATILHELCHTSMAGDLNDEGRRTYGWRNCVKSRCDHNPGKAVPREFRLHQLLIRPQTPSCCWLKVLSFIASDMKSRKMELFLKDNNPTFQE